MYRKLILLLLCASLSGGFLLADEKPSRVEHSKSLSRDGAALGTSVYEPTAAEKRVVKNWTEEELATGSPDTNSLSGLKGRRVRWFGVVRTVTENAKENETRLLVEMKYFDGLTDLHLQVVSINGAGDFQVVIPETGHKLKPLSLVRVYGKVTGEAAGIPTIAADYVRAWSWGQFTFMPYGQDHSNAEWVKLRKTAADDVYTSAPSRKYYEQLLGPAAKPRSNGQWTSLLDGENLDAWDVESTSPPDEWTVQNGILSTTPSGDGWLKSNDVYDDFELRLEFRMSKEANSGVFLRADGYTPHVEGLEVQLLDNDAFPDLPNSKTNGALMLESGPRKRVSKKAGEWQTLFVKCQGSKITIKIDDQVVVEEDLSAHKDREADHPGRKSKSGHIGLQNRGEKVDFRKIEIRELN